MSTHQTLPSLRRLARRVLLWLALVLPLAQTLGLVHLAGHAVGPLAVSVGTVGESPAAERSALGDGHATLCELCLLAVAALGAAPLAASVALAVAPRERVASAPRRSTARGRPRHHPGAPRAPPVLT